MKNNKKISKKQIALHLFFILCCCTFIYPILLLVGVSFSTEADVLRNGYKLIPEHFTLAAYKFVFDSPQQIIDSYEVTIFVSVVVTIFSLILQSMIAFPLTRKNLRGRKVLSFYLYFTMLFSGGMVAHYIVNSKYYGLGNSIWIYLLPGLISPWNIFMIRTNFQQLPEELFESVKMDGGNAYVQYFKFALPLSKPVLATVAFNTFLGNWNQWQTSLLYIRDKSLYTLQYLLQQMLDEVEIIKQMADNMQFNGVATIADIPSETVRMAMALIVTGPAIFVFPLFQKYFVKGLTVGSVKG